MMLGGAMASKKKKANRYARATECEVDRVSVSGDRLPVPAFVRALFTSCSEGAPTLATIRALQVASHPRRRSAGGLQCELRALRSSAHRMRQLAIGDDRIFDADDDVVHAHVQAVMSGSRPDTVR